MVTNENSVEGKKINLYYYGMVSFANDDTTVSGFQILITYRGATIAEALAANTPSFLVNNTYSNFSSYSIDFYPKNEGEIATYVFKWVFGPETTLISTTYKFFIRFPKEFDPGLTKYGL